MDPTPRPIAVADPEASRTTRTGAESILGRLALSEQGDIVRVLLIEDHKPMVRALKKGLEEEGFAVDTAADGEEGDYKARTASYDVIILDVMLPKIDGLSLLREWRRSGLTSHVLVLTARSSMEDKVQGLDLGADDYLTKPFQLEELMARIRALIRRGHQVKNPIIRAHDLEIDTAARTVKRAGKPIHLTPREFALLQYLAYHQGQVVTRSMIWEHLYDEQDENTSNVVDVYIRYLRTKIDKGFEPPLILTRWGEGYMLRGENS
jgi:DNA-binding response OmpR family regulator